MNAITLQETGAGVCEMQQTFHSDMDQANIFYSVEETEADSHSIIKNNSTMPPATVVSLLNYHNSYRKPCNCAKSHCLKLYCECFARGAVCDGCNCTNCMNNVTHDDARRKAIKLTLERNPLAFHPKIGENDRKHSKGCNCKRSGCLKNYCECYEAKINCSDLCRCQGCRNIDNECPHDSASQLGTLPIVKPKSSHAPKRSSVYHRCADQFVRLPHANQAFGHFDDQSEAMIAYRGYPGVTIIPNGFLSLEVTEAACSCMLAQLEEAKQRAFSPVSQERVILEEFGKCLEQILESAAKLQYNGTCCDETQYVSDHNNLLPKMDALNHARMQLLDAVPGDQINYGPGTSFHGLPTFGLQNTYGADGTEHLTHHETTIVNLTGRYSATELTIPQSEGTQFILHGAPERASSDLQCIPAAYSPEWVDHPVLRMYQISDDPSTSSLPIQTLQYSQLYPQCRQADFEIQTIQPVHPVQITQPSGQQLQDHRVLERPPSMRAMYSGVEHIRNVADTPENLYIFGGESIGPHPTFGRSATASHSLSSIDERTLTIPSNTGVTTILSIPEDEETEVQTATEALLHASNTGIPNELLSSPQFELSVGEDLDPGDSAHFEGQVCVKYPDMSTNPTFDSTSIGDQSIPLKRETCYGVNPTCDSESTTAHIPSFFRPQLRFCDL